MSDTHQDREIDSVRSFIKRYANIGLFSTGARLVEFSDELYNVSGSTDDPREVPDHQGVTWKKLLIRLAGLASASCYVINEKPDGKSSHPDFSVGGHMTPNSTGIVPVGDVSYLMPLCKWHNSTSRDGVAFEHAETRMLELTGFMEGDTAVTFALRLDSRGKYSLLYFDRAKGSWDFTNVDDENLMAPRTEPFHAKADLVASVQEYVLFERRGDRHFVKETNL